MSASHPDPRLVRVQTITNNGDTPISTKPCRVWAVTLNHRGVTGVTVAIALKDGAATVATVSSGQAAANGQGFVNQSKLRGLMFRTGLTATKTTAGGAAADGGGTIVWEDTGS